MKGNDCGQGKVNGVMNDITLDESDDYVNEFEIMSENGKERSGLEVESEFYLDPLDTSDVDFSNDSNNPSDWDHTIKHNMGKAYVRTYDGEVGRTDKRSKVSVIDEELEDGTVEVCSSKKNDVLELFEDFKSETDTGNKVEIDPLELTKHMMEQAWKDGCVTEDEMGLLDVLADMLGLSTDDFNRILRECRPITSQGMNQKKRTGTVEDFKTDSDLLLDEVDEEVLPKPSTEERTTPVPELINRPIIVTQV